MTQRLRDEVAIVTGSTSGLGREIATLFAEEGASVAVSGRRADVGEAIVRALPRVEGADHLFVAGDLTTPEGRAALIDRTIAQFGRLTVLVNNAVSPTAIARDGMVTTIDHQLWHDMLSITLVAAAEMCRLAIPHLLDAGGGSIVNVSAKSASLARPEQAAYSSAKAGMNALSRSIAADYSRRGVRCNALQPGYIIHEGREPNMSDERRAQLEGMQLTRLATARDVALAALFLASRESEVITGITLPVDGGSTSVRGRVL
jgi:NAD(P)-dependent dehydrogenase (short-subunit alcohol dehydrogenase family)